MSLEKTKSNTHNWQILTITENTVENNSSNEIIYPTFTDELVGEFVYLANLFDDKPKELFIPKYSFLVA